MRHDRVALALAVLVLVCAVPKAHTGGAMPSSPRDSAPGIEAFLRIRTPGPPILLPDRSLLVRDWPEGVWQLYRVTPRTGSDGARSYRPGEATFAPLTDYPDGLQGFSVSPDGRLVVLLHAPGGNENTQLTLLDLDAAPAAARTPVLADPRVQARVNLWLRDGSGFVYSANADSPTDFHLYRWDRSSRKVTRILARSGAWSARDVTADGSRVLVQQAISASDVRCHELELATGRLRDLTLRPAGGGTAACEAVGYAPGETSVLLISDHAGGMKRLYQADLRGGRVREPLPARSRFELDEAMLSEGRELLVAVTNEDGYGVMHVHALPGFAELPPPTRERGVGNVWSFRGRTLVWSVSHAQRAGSAFATTYPPPRSRALPVTEALTWPDDRGIDLSAFRPPALIRYPAFDGREIPAFLYLPAGARAGEPVPFIVSYHGGPEGQHRPGFNATMQYLLSRGFGVLMPNVRGSTGYGREFQMLDDYTRRWDSVRDGVDAAEWLVAKGYARPGRIATYGGSYGGFMSVACLVEDQERVRSGARRAALFGAGVDVVGIVNLQTFLERTSDYRRRLREVEYGPLSDSTFLASVSSIHRVDRIRVPMFIAHGFNDPRVPVEEAMQLAVALKRHGMRPQVFIAPDEGHGFQKLDNRIYFTERAAAFLEEAIGR